ncbi:hypothetical protein MSP8886_00804 [Marinomonas spartinae]|uniref:Bacterial lipoprotein (DUF940) n=1 Tax=Marinomonas spartinae TaxID=1792290 RepID=A0A1A8T700_9GAMM|nr:YjbH domain-containing protein [Marinomonas spartinae]SBS27104.1 hypothetical protein MSP8886_00804 [Marinomonas spartinae]
MLYPRFILISLIACSSLVHASNEEQPLLSPPFVLPPFKPTQMDFGGVGLMQMPTGRMAKDGEFNAGYSHNDNYNFYTLSIQLMPWLESTIRYTQVSDALYSNDPQFSGNTKYTDKGIDLKLRLLKESQYLPETSLGFRDIGGTGLFDGEFIAATKRLSTNRFGQFDFTLGLGWGYLGRRNNIKNPFCTLSNRLCQRSNQYSGNGGEIDYKRFFHGDTALFGGIEYQTPYEPLRLKLEYDSNNYRQDYAETHGNANLTPSTPWNIGAVYAVNDFTNLKLSYERGNTLTLGINLHANFNDQPSIWKATPVPALTNNHPIKLTDVNWKKLDDDLSKIAGYQNSEFYHHGDTVTVVAHQTQYRDRNLAHERAAAVLANALPTKIKQYDVIEQDQRIPLTNTQINADKYKKVANVSYINANIKDATQPTKINKATLNTKPIYDGQSTFQYGFGPHLEQSFGSPETFYLYSLDLDGYASYWFNPHLQLSSSLSFHVLNNYDKFNFLKLNDGTNNYRVRSLVRAYMDKDTSISNLQLTWFEKYHSNWYQQVYAGYLETMFAGVGSEVLYRQPNANWAIGADLNLVSQRDPNTTFGIYNNIHGYGQNTKVLVKKPTGHLSVYYEPRWKAMDNLLFRVDVGQFLAQDFGTRVDISRQFKTGIIVGAFAAKTTMSAKDYGEGSFTKGFYISIPFDLMSIHPTTERGTLPWQPLTRDGGQMLAKRYSLFNITDPVSPWFGRPSSIGKSE